MSNIEYKKLVEEYIKNEIIWSSLWWEVISSATKFIAWSASEAYLLQTSKSKYVFKAISWWIFRDIKAFQIWKKSWVITPSIVNIFESKELQYYIMDYIDWTMLDSARLKDPIAFHYKLWEVLWKMHQWKTVWYRDFENWIEPIKWTTVTLKEMYDGKYPRKEILKKWKDIWFNGEDILNARESIIEFCNWMQTSCCHNDLYLHNIFDEDNIVIIDPNTDLDIWELDLCRTLYYTIMEDYFVNYSEVISWYRDCANTSITNELICNWVLLRGLKVLLNENNLGKLALFKNRYENFKSEILSQ